MIMSFVVLNGSWQKEAFCLLSASDVNKKLLYSDNGMRLGVLLYGLTNNEFTVTDLFNVGEEGVPNSVMVRTLRLHYSLSLTIGHGRINSEACEKVVGDLVLANGFPQVVWFPPPIND